MRFRKALLSAHLAVGLAAGLILLSMAGSGILIAFAPQLSDWADREAMRVSAPEGAEPLRPGALARAAAAAYPGSRVESLAWRPGPRAAVRVGLDKEGVAYLDPYTGAALGRASSLRRAFAAIEHWHRWMGEAKRGKALTGASALALALLALSGAFLWVRSPATRKAFRRGRLPSADARVAHGALGFWSGAMLLIIAVTGIAMAYSGPAKTPGKGARAGIGTREADRGASGNLGAARISDAAWDSALSLAKARCPGWRTIAVRIPSGAEAGLAARIETEGFLRFPLRSRLEVDAGTGRERKWEPYRAKGLGGGWRAWMVPLHTGRGFGLPGQAAACAAAVSLLILIATGFRLGARRLTRIRRGFASRITARRRSRTGIPADALPRLPAKGKGPVPVPEGPGRPRRAFRADR